jgi:hypothetical protein
VITVKYEKPEITAMASAIQAIECSGSKAGGPTDCGEFISNKTTNAYEADE